MYLRTQGGIIEVIAEHAFTPTFPGYWQLTKAALRSTANWAVLQDCSQKRKIYLTLPGCTRDRYL